MSEGNSYKFSVGAFVVKTKGAKFWGLVIASYTIPIGPSRGQKRYDVMAVDPGFIGTIHIFSEDQMALCSKEEIRDVIQQRWEHYDAATHIDLEELGLGFS